ncbi:MAG TPA: helix-turn-helix domain-containing protein [Candidatus Dormibacteraeota bacterium]|nr:helix-turn-helix domain-containing protein [Candidatus Dormibacteraeota bacterium]
MSVSSRAASESPLTQRQWVRRGELLEAARRVFERDGYHSTTVSAVVQAAGLSQGAFYLYFADKKGVFAALQNEMATLLRRRIYWATRDETDARRRLVAGLEAFFEFYQEYAAWSRRLTMEGLGIDESFEARQTELQQTLAAAFVPTLTELAVRETAVAAFALLGMAAQLAYWQHFQRLKEPSMSAAALAQACASLFLNGAASIPSSPSQEGGRYA